MIFEMFTVSLLQCINKIHTVCLKCSSFSNKVYQKFILKSFVKNINILFYNNILKFSSKTYCFEI